MLSPKKLAILVVSFVALLSVSLLSSSLFETNMAGHVQVKQAAAAGDWDISLDECTQQCNAHIQKLEKEWADSCVPIKGAPTSTNNNSWKE